VLEFLGAVGSIILIDLVLSGDNALVIGAAAAGLPRRQRWSAIALGGGGAIILRIVFAVGATLLLRLPLLQAIGGILLLVIAVRLLVDRSSTHTEPANSARQAGMAQESQPGAEKNVSDKRGLWAALLTILVADVTMSLDNVLAIGALAAGNLPLLAAGLLLSIALLLLGSALVAELIGRFSWLLDVAALVLAWTAGNMILADVRLHPLFEQLPWIRFALPTLTLVIVIAADVLLRLRNARAVSRKSAA
jgi:YjbE family integral membrane protein